MEEDMEEEMEDFVQDCCTESAETDEAYEFDASHFFDFARPEFDSEVEEAERWFEVSGDYYPSPFIVKLNLEKLLSVEVVPNPSKAKCSKNAKSISSSSDSDGKHGVSTSGKKAKGKSHHVLQDAAKAKPKSADKVFQPKSSTLMNPTASHLAKKCKPNDQHSSHLCTRFQKTSAKIDQKRVKSPPRFDNLATKRQKLEIGYLKKVAQLKHQFSLPHKSSKKVTIPREPELETQLRAQRRGSKNSSAASETEKQKPKGPNFKAHPLNKKAPSLSQPKKSTPRSPEFHVSHLKTSERANHHAFAKEGRLSTDDELLESPPVEQFTELSLVSDVKTSKTSQLDRHTSAKASGKAMGLKKDTHDSFQAGFQRCHAKPNQCGGHMRIHEAGNWSNMTRSLGIS